MTVGPGSASSFHDPRGLIRPVPAAAEEQHRRVEVAFGSQQLLKKSRIARAFRIGVPFNKNAARNSPHIVPFGTRPHIDEPCPGERREQRGCLGGRHRTRIWQAALNGPLLRRSENRRNGVRWGGRRGHWMVCTMTC